VECGGKLGPNLVGSSPDSPLEQSGFETLVPLEKGRALLRADRDLFRAARPTAKPTVGLRVRIRLAPAASRTNSLRAKSWLGRVFGQSARITRYRGDRAAAVQSLDTVSLVKPSVLNRSP
jgi:hypothetical protein